jgi:RND family efflux transporter MFP subunit
MNKALDSFWPVLLALLLLTAEAAVAQQPTEDRAIPVTVATAATRGLEEWQPSLGRLVARTAPMIAAEIGGHVVAVNVDVGQQVDAGQVLAEIDDTDYRLGKQLVIADIERLKSLIRAQQLQVRRYQKLVRQKSANQSALDDAEAQLGSLRAQLVGARVRLQQAERNLEKTRIVSPVPGQITERRISVGDYLKPGTPVFGITTPDTLQAQLPYPQSQASRLEVGQAVRLASPFNPGVERLARITEINPEISPSSLAITVLINVNDPGPWKPGSSIKGEVRVRRVPDAVVVSEGCVIRRPAGQVVYRVEQGRVVEVPVRTGLRDGGWVQILSGIRAGDRLALDGAAYLSDGTRVAVKTPTSGKPQ